MDNRKESIRVELNFIKDMIDKEFNVIRQADKRINGWIEKKAELQGELVELQVRSFLGVKSCKN